MHRRALLGAAAALITSRAHSHSSLFQGIEIGHAWVLPATSGETRAFVPIGSRTVHDRLIGATSAAAQRIELCLHDGGNGVTDGFDFGPRLPIAMRPGARHLRLIGLTRVLEHGHRIVISLRFRDAGTTAVDFWIEPAPYAPFKRSTD